ncbi:unnamed protein product [Psylliodes chrysocephalus]|uniref:BESS domain-containing protein n=1 Tax=Psylliodes chrysocephalus TaxID=3402493 RepID=A0A9P0GMX4_9CUCU|nr:unnamed protein product [Psylliodes chrysocephala]
MPFRTAMVPNRSESRVSEETSSNANETENHECEFEPASQPTEIREENNDTSAYPTQIEETSSSTSNAYLVADSKKEKEKFMKPPTPKRKKQSKTDSVNDSQLQAILNFLQQPDDPNLMYTQHLANKLRQFSDRTRAMIEHAINQIIFEAEMGYYDNPLDDPHFRTQVPTPAFSPNAAEGSPWSAHTNSSSNSAQPDKQAQEEDNLLTSLQPFITL